MSAENTLWMGDIEPSMNESIILESFKFFNIIPTNVKLIKDKRKNINKTYCFVTFKNIQDANKALKNLNGNKLPTANINFKLNWADYQTNSTKTAYVGNLSANIGDKELCELFSQKYKSVHHANVIYENGVSKGYGFVTFKNEDDYFRSLKEMNGIDFYGNKIKVRVKIKKDENNASNNNNINNNINGNKNRDKIKNNFYDFNRGKMNNKFLNNKNYNDYDMNINIPLLYQNNMNNNNQIQNFDNKIIELRKNSNINNFNNINFNNNNINQQINYFNNNNIKNSLINDINHINNNSINNKNNIINFNTIQNINIINSNNINDNNSNHLLQNNRIINYNNNQSQLEYLLNRIENPNNNNALINEPNKINENKNISKINHYKNKKENNLVQLEQKKIISINDKKLNLNMNNNIRNKNMNSKKEKEKENKINININNGENNNSNKNKKNNNNKKGNIKLVDLEKIDEKTLCKKIHESIQRTFEYHKKMFNNNGIKFKSKYKYI